MLKAVMFSKNTKKFFEVGLTELNRFYEHFKVCNLRVCNKITIGFKELASIYKPDYIDDSWNTEFYNFLNSLQTDDYLFIHEGFLQDWECMVEIKNKYIEELNKKLKEGIDFSS